MVAHFIYLQKMLSEKGPGTIIYSLSVFVLFKNGLLIFFFFSIIHEANNYCTDLLIQLFSDTFMRYVKNMWFVLYNWLFFISILIQLLWMTAGLPECSPSSGSKFPLLNLLNLLGTILSPMAHIFLLFVLQFSFIFTFKICNPNKSYRKMQWNLIFHNMYIWKCYKLVPLQ